MFACSHVVAVVAAEVRINREKLTGFDEARLQFLDKSDGRYWYLRYYRYDIVREFGHVFLKAGGGSRSRSRKMTGGGQAARIKACPRRVVDLISSNE